MSATNTALLNPPFTFLSTDHGTAFLNLLDILRDAVSIYPEFSRIFFT